MFATLVVDDKMVVYADGVFIGKAKRWNIGRVCDPYECVIYSAHRILDLECVLLLFLR